jgi:hypothetical protein
VFAQQSWTEFIVSHAGVPGRMRLPEFVSTTDCIMSRVGDKFQDLH